MTPVSWIWLRHLPAAGTEGTLCGRLDPPIAKPDPARTAALAASLPTTAQVLSSPLARCRQTMAAIRAAGGPQADPDPAPEFLEQSFGDWEGRRYADIPALSSWTIHDYAEKAPPGGESFAAMCARVAGGIEGHNAVGSDVPLIVCTHAGVIRAALAHALDMPPAKAQAFAVDCGSITRITCLGPAGRRIEQVNVRP
ncbi:alpha-ribazole phosphatase [Constrictibacter sp. MBR-5]|jgi:alpha-ribazole phosphatase|uniref:histidine phosphatase family protein n=1 Tax=Constrictibacter sp. MBR-5 TaxID=3156467 RepID=UPI00339A76BA